LELEKKTELIKKLIGQIGGILEGGRRGEIGSERGGGSEEREKWDSREREDPK